MKGIVPGIAITLLTASFSNYGAEIKSLGACQAKGVIQVVCDVKNPEDMVLLPSGKNILVSQFDNVENAAPGGLGLYQIDKKQFSQLFPLSGIGTEPQLADDRRWGDKECLPPTKQFSPHGIGFVKRTDGESMLAVVNHGGRESIELFRVAETEKTAIPEITNTQPNKAAMENQVQLEWRGCFHLDKDIYPNDVVALKDGGVIYTHMGVPPEYKNGSVYEWHQAQKDPIMLPETTGVLLNGIQISPDEKLLYINYYRKGLVQSYDRATQKITAKIEVPYPDNSSFNRKGHLLVASHDGSFDDIQKCMKMAAGETCALPFSIYAIDFDKKVKRRIYANKGEPMGAGTIAIEAGNSLYIGSFKSNRIMIVPRAKVPGGKNKSAFWHNKK